MVGEVTAVAARQNPGMRGESAAGKWCGRHRDLSLVLPDFRERSIAIDCEQWVGGGGKCMEVETEDDGKGMDALRCDDSAAENLNSYELWSQ